MTARLKGKEVRQVVSVRMEPSKKALLVKRYGSVQEWVDKKLKREQGEENSERAKTKPV